MVFNLGAPSNSNVGLSPIQVKPNALGKIKQVPVGGGNVFLDPSTSSKHVTQLF